MPEPMDGPPEPRRWRLDETGPRPANPPQASGRTTVAALVLSILALWVGLDLVFRGWKARYDALARFGASEVAPAVDPLAEINPPDVPPADWRAAVADTHAMLLALTGAGVLDRPQMDRLREDIANRVAHARPETARKALAQLWDDLERDAGPLIAPDTTPPPPNSRHAARNPRPPRPKLLGPSLANRPSPRP
jgi:hypothetical protein